MSSDSSQAQVQRLAADAEALEDTEQHQPLGRTTTLARRYLATNATPMGAYMALQLRVLQRLATRRGTSLDEACERWSPAFAARFRWMLNDCEALVSARSFGSGPGMHPIPD